MSCRTLVPQPGIEPVPPAVEAWSSDHWTTRQVPSFSFLTMSLHPLPVHTGPDMKSSEWSIFLTDHFIISFCLTLRFSLHHWFSAVWQWHAICFYWYLSWSGCFQLPISGVCCFSCTLGKSQPFISSSIFFSFILWGLNNMYVRLFCTILWLKDAVISCPPFSHLMFQCGSFLLTFPQAHWFFFSANRPVEEFFISHIMVSLVC